VLARAGERLPEIELALRTFQTRDPKDRTQP
jgi:hypothetical protein